MGLRLGLMGFAASLILAQLPSGRFTDENAGFEKVIQALISTYDHADVLALGEDHGRQFDSDLRIGIVRHPDFAKKVRFIVVEFAATAQQPILDRYIRGEDVPISETGVWDSPVYTNFLMAVRGVNRGQRNTSRLRVLAGGADPLALSILKDQVLEKHSKALVVYGAGHLFKTDGSTNLFSSTGGGITKTLEADYPGRTFVVITLCSEPHDSQVDLFCLIAVRDGMQKLRIESSETGQVLGVVRIGFLIATGNCWNLTSVSSNNLVAQSCQELANPSRVREATFMAQMIAQ